MCGIAGAAWNEEGAPLDEAVLRNMTAALAHRGPDGEGFHYKCNAAGGVAMGHRRLAIIDLAGGGQPLSNEDGTIWVVFNGEIYNYVELRQELLGQGHVFRTQSDTEVLVHAYEQFGPASLQRLRGMFAVAIWDGPTRTLFLARDRLGKKPLLYCRQRGRVLFASEAKALLQVPDLPRELNPDALDQYLRYLYIPHPRTIYRGIAKLPPGHYAVFRDGRLDIRRYWELNYEQDDALSPEDFRARLRETLTEATRLRLRSDVPLGVFLSGGIDSTIVTGLVQQLAQTPVKAFTIGFPVAGFDETDYARQSAEHLGVEWITRVVSADAAAILPKLVHHYDEPFGDSSAIPTYYLSQWVRQHVTVALTGDAGDELFAGYPWHQTMRIAEWLDRLPAPLRHVMKSRWWQRFPAANVQASRLRRAKRLAELLGRSAPDRYLTLNRPIDDDFCDALYSDDFRGALNGFDPGELVSASFARSAARDPVTRATFADIASYLPGDILTKVDIASMAHGLECRSPFLDHHVVELAARMPISLKMRGLTGKQIVRDTFADLFTAENKRRGKMGFSVPLGAWLRGPLRGLCQDVLLDPATLARGYFRPAAVRNLMNQHLSETWDHSPALWALLMFELWHRAYLDSAGRHGETVVGMSA